ncbi:succinylglutamate desuccinylase/aspartoacylase family protein [Litoribacter ruber]|uniref:succinylglutamate desuccinylase/aspartoacylase family protein n=1 Tax=Litoribacter ruber TaxID=702568 RepID=UPI001BDA4CA3|nr:succinylglutamate desuccinylase/aspartoacylase family protein [Litoribacter ruber]MBT0813083.1 succinylglutamate desuccinylase/aspartoacylase family protein [Litoribacter ruber]
MRNEGKVQDLNLNRILGKYPSSPIKGPTLLVSAGVHGNEPSGVLALKRVFKKLEQEKPQFKGQIIGVSGNLEALKNQVRLVDRDLNRVCTPDNASKIEMVEELSFHEAKEFKELLKVIQEIEENPNSTRLFFMDLHTTSSPTVPYISVNKGEESYGFAMKFPLPVAKGIEKYIPGHFDHYLTLLGHVGFTVEAGQHEAPESVDYHEAMVIVGLVNSGLVEKSDIRDYDHYYNRLKETFGGEEGYKVVYRHHIDEGDLFKMEPGYSNFKEVKKGELLAHSNNEQVFAPMDGRIFLPLYQSQGSDGFFIVQ